MEGLLKILFIEDVISDAELIWREIANNNITFTKLLVDNRKDFVDGLESFKPDIIISDYNLPTFDGISALKFRNEHTPLIPFILVTGSINEEVAVDCMKAGADDYILKGNLSRLGPAIINSIHKIALLKEKMEIENALLESEERFRNLYDDAVSGLYRTNLQGEFLMANKALIKILGFQTFEELKTKNPNLVGYKALYHRNKFIDQIEKESEVRDLETIWICKDGKEILVKVSVKAIRNSENRIIFYDGVVEDITERKKVEKDLGQSKRLIEGILNAIPARVFWKDMNLVYLGCNTIFARDAGFNEPGDIIGKDDYQLVWHEQADLYRNDDWDVISTGKSKFDIEESQSTPDGNNITLLTNKVPLLDFNGKVSGILGTYIDITQRKLAEEAVTKSEARFRSYFDSSIVGIAITSPSKGWIEVNEHLCDLLGYTREELLRTTWSELTHSEDLNLDFEQFDRVLKGEIDAYNIDKRFICKNGEIKWTSLSVRCVRHADGQVDYFIALLFDISERKRAEEVINSERSLLRIMIDNLPARIYVKDAKGRRIIANNADVEYFGFDKEAAVIGKTDIDLISEKMGKRGCTDDKKVITTGESLFNCEESFIDKNGMTRWFLTSKIPLFDKVGKATGLVGIGLDITERKKNEAELIWAKEKAEESDRLKTAFLNNISHEIRTPLNSIVGFATLLGNSELTPQKKKEFVNIIFESNDQLLSIISGILSLASLETGQVKISEDITDLNKLILNVYDQFIINCTSAEVAFTYHLSLPDKMAFIYTDPVKLTQILVNLVGNAMKFTQKGKVRFGYTILDNEIQFYVEDTGLGIPEDMKELIFERFMQVDNSPTRKYGGTGLGLSISKGYVELMGGNMMVSSELGMGSVFSFTLPYKPVAPVQTDEIINRKDSEISIPPGKTILVAEDETNNFLLIKEILKDMQLEVIRAFNGFDAVKFCSPGNLPDLILMDIKMPEMDGIEATKRIKRLYPRLPIIALTACAIEEDKKEILLSGCDEYIQKPINRQLLLDKLVKYLAD